MSLREAGEEERFAIPWISFTDLLFLAVASSLVCWLAVANGKKEAEVKAAEERKRNGDLAVKSEKSETEAEQRKREAETWKSKYGSESRRTGRLTTELTDSEKERNKLAARIAELTNEKKSLMEEGKLLTMKIAELKAQPFEQQLADAKVKIQEWEGRAAKFDSMMLAKDEAMRALKADFQVMEERVAAAEKIAKDAGQAVEGERKRANDAENNARLKDNEIAVLRNRALKDLGDTDLVITVRSNSLPERYSLHLLVEDPNDHIVIWLRPYIWTGKSETGRLIPSQYLVPPKDSTGQPQASGTESAQESFYCFKPVAGSGRPYSVFCMICGPRGSREKRLEPHVKVTWETKLRGEREPTVRGQGEVSCTGIPYLPPQEDLYRWKLKTGTFFGLGQFTLQRSANGTLTVQDLNRIPSSFRNSSVTNIGPEDSVADPVD